MPPGRVRWSVALALLLWALAPGSALAHGVVLGSDPPGACPDFTVTGLLSGSAECGALNVLLAPPSEVRLHFSEPVSPFGRGLIVLGPDGRPVDRGPVRTEGPDLAVDVDAGQTGTYTVQWQVISTDTHPARGSYRFAVGHPGGAGVITGTSEGAVAPVGLVLQTAGRWLHFVGYALAFGVLAFRWLFMRAAPVKRLNRLVSAGIVLLVVAEGLGLLGQTGSLGAEYMLDPPTMSAALDSSFGRALALRLGAPVLLWVLVGIARGGAAWALPVSLGEGALLGVLDGFSAHAASGQAPALGLLANGLHEGAMGVWVGGLAAWLTVRTVDFGRLAWRAAVALVITGLAMAIIHLSSAGDLVTTAYGNALAAKVLLVLLVAGLAAAARRYPAMRWVEAAGLGLVLLMAGLLVVLPPPR